MLHASKGCVLGQGFRCVCVVCQMEWKTTTAGARLHILHIRHGQDTRFSGIGKRLAYGYKRSEGTCVRGIGDVTAKVNRDS
jgi:hypothetical protein